MSPLPRTRCPKKDCNEWKPCKVHSVHWRSSKREMPRDWGRLVRAIKDKARWRGWRCDRCNRPDDGGQVDHIIPAAEGGLDDLTNLQWLCRKCHSTKSMREAMRGQIRARASKKKK